MQLQFVSVQLHCSRRKKFESIANMPMVHSRLNSKMILVESQLPVCGDLLNRIINAYNTIVFMQLSDLQINEWHLLDLDRIEKFSNCCMCEHNAIVIPRVL